MPAKKSLARFHSSILPSTVAVSYVGWAASVVTGIIACTSRRHSQTSGKRISVFWGVFVKLNSKLFFALSYIEQPQHIPTLRWVFQMLEGIDQAVFSVSGKLRTLIEGITVSPSTDSLPFQARNTPDISDLFTIGAAQCRIKQGGIGGGRQKCRSCQKKVSKVY